MRDSIAARPVSLIRSVRLVGLDDQGYLDDRSRGGLLDRATEATIGQLEPFFNLLAFLRDGQGFFDVGGCE